MDLNLIFKRRSGITISSEYKNEDFYKNIKRALTRKSKDFHSDIIIERKFYLESEKNLIIPRFFPIEKYINCKINDLAHEGKDIDIEHTIELRNELQKEVTDFMLSNNNGVIQVPPGVGKTVMSIYMITIRKKKSLILVHKDYLVEQWKERFIEFTNLNEDDIMRLTSSNYQEVLEAPIIIVTAQTFLSLIKRNIEDFLIYLNKANIGVFVADEVHTTVGAPLFSECSIHIPAKYTFGLSATPYRFDGNHDMIEHHLGQIKELEDFSGTVPANITVILMDFKIIKEGTKNRHTYLFFGGKFQRARYLNILKNSKFFMSVCNGLLKKFSNKNVIFISERIKMIDQLFESLDHNDKGIFISGSKKEDLHKQIVFSTPGKIRDGVDIPKKDTLIMTSPISNIAQICGRVTRSFEGKEEATIIDMVDITLPQIRNSFMTRLTYYEKRKWNVNFLRIHENGKKESINKEDALDLIITTKRRDL